MSFGGSFQGSSRMPPSKERCSMFRSIEYGFFTVVGTGMPCRSANSIMAVRLCSVQFGSRHGAMIVTPGISAI